MATKEARNLARALETLAGHGNGNLRVALDADGGQGWDPVFVVDALRIVLSALQHEDTGYYEYAARSDALCLLLQRHLPNG